MDPPLTPALRVYRDLRAASRALARHVATAGTEAVADHARFRLVISGGSTPIPLFRLLAGAAGRRVPWSATEVYFADERCVPPDDPASNFGAARRMLLERVGLRPRSIHPVVSDGKSPHQAAAAYDRVLAAMARAAHPRPAFDLVLLGIGPDGHTASLFPSARGLEERHRRAIAVVRPGLLPTVPRVTMTLPAIADSREVCFLVAGCDKARAMRQILGGRGRKALPAAQVTSKGPVRWFVDRAAAPGLASS